jgi:hypothetical protein
MHRHDRSQAAHAATARASHLLTISVRRGGGRRALGTLSMFATLVMLAMLAMTFLSRRCGRGGLAAAAGVCVLSENEAPKAQNKNESQNDSQSVSHLLNLLCKIGRFRRASGL